MAFQGFRNDYATTLPRLSSEERLRMKAAVASQNGEPAPERINIEMRKGNDAFELLLYDVIDPMFGITLDDVDAMLREVPKGAALNIRMNSPGGDVFEGISIYNRIAQHDSKKVGYVDGMAGSIMSIIALSVDTLLMGQGAMYMVHKPITGVYGNAFKLRTWAEALDQTQANMRDLYVHESGNTPEAITAWMDHENGFGTFMTAAEAIERGFADGYAKDATKKTTKAESEVALRNYWQAHLMIARAKASANS